MTKTTKAARVLFVFSAAASLILIVLTLFTLLSETAKNIFIYYYSFPQLISFTMLCILSVCSFITLKKVGMKTTGILYAVYAIANMAAGIYELFTEMSIGVYFKGVELLMIWLSRDAYLPFIIACFLLPLTFCKSSKPLRMLNMILISLQLLDVIVLYVPTVITWLITGLWVISLLPLIIRTLMYITLYTALLLTVITTSERKQ